LWIAAGSVLLCGALLVSLLVVNEYAAWTVAFLALLLYEGLVNFTGLGSYGSIDLFRFMNGSSLAAFDPTTRVFTSFLPWQPIAGTGAIAAVFLIAAGALSRRTDY
jgi:hypothetical protein